MERQITAKIVIRNDDDVAWRTANPVLLMGEIGIENNTKKFKIGDGSTTWNNLEYFASGIKLVVKTFNPKPSNVEEIGTIWLNSTNNSVFVALANTSKVSMVWKQLVFTSDLENLGAGDMLKAVYATNDKVGYVDNAVQADVLSVAKAISISGDATGSAAFDGSQDINIVTTLEKSGVIAGTYTKLKVDDRGIVLGGSSLAESDIPSIPRNKVTGLGTASGKNIGVAEGTVPILGAGGKLSPDVLPSVAITDTFVVASQSAMLQLAAQKGDMAIRTDVKKTFVLKTEPANTLSNWVELPTPTDTVTSVNGQTGIVTLTTTNISEGPESTNKYFTEGRAKAAAKTLNASELMDGKSILYSTDVITLDGGGAADK